MSSSTPRIFVGTRKGLFRYERVARGGWRLAATAFLGDPVTMVLPEPSSNRLYVALNLGHFGVKLHVSEDAGGTFTELPAPAFPAREDAGDDEARRDAPAVKQIWALAHGGRDGVLWAGTIPGAVFRSDDGGRSWRLNEPLWNVPERARWFGGGYDDPGIHSILVHPGNPDRLTVGVSCGGVWTSDDAGGTWSLVGRGMFAEYMPPERREDLAIQDPHRVVQCRAHPERLWVQHHNGVFRSADGGASWNHCAAAQPSGFGFAVAAHPEDPETAWFVPAVKDECRIPVGGRFVVSRTRDGGASFEVLTRGLPSEHAYHLVYRHAMDVDATGGILAMGSTTGGLWVSENGGQSWENLTQDLPPVYTVHLG